jgi:hypothetical protein
MKHFEKNNCCRNIAIFLVLLAVFAVLGCRKPHNLKYIEGTVTLDGKPVEAVSVSFLPVDSSKGLGAGGYTDVNGKFKLSSLVGKGGDGTQAGKYSVIFVKLIPAREMTENEKQLAQTDPERVPAIPMIDALPSKYRSPKTSGIEAEVTESGSNVFNFDLSSH